MTGGFDLGLERTGWRCAGQIEIDPFCSRILERRFPHVTRWLDVREWKSDGDEHIDLVCGGSPCQAFSVAGLRESLDDDRGNLAFEFVRICNEIRPDWIIWENVPGVLSTKDNAFGCFLAALVGADAPLISPLERGRWSDAGMAVGPQRAAAWRCLDSQYFGVAQRRKRVFVVCGPTAGSVAQVLFEPKSSSGHSSSRRKAGADIARSLTGGASGYRFDPNGEESIVSDPLTSKPYADNEAQHRKLIFVIKGAAIGRKPEAGPQYGEVLEGGPVYTLNATEVHAIAAPLTASYGKQIDSSDRNGGPPNLIFQPNVSSTQSMNPHPLAPTMGATKGLGVVGSMGVRRLTPLEAERLQAFPPGWTCLCQPLEIYTEDPDEVHLRCKCPDGPRYKALGNAVTVSVVEFLGRRLAAVADQ